ncbi:hypothetical protein GOODEAATRI_011028 [Goodea atripinnis]|uniref:Uncharacterized protein n=1 Tax=Goodea atripinnis TaxID=208336 RepID=A0ABV0MJR1_9TELE
MGGLGLYFECKRRIWLGLKEGTEECGGKFRKERSMICVCQWLREKYNMNMQQQSFMLAGQAPDNRTSHTLCFLYQLRGMSSYISRLTISNFNSGKLEGWTQEIMALIHHARSICSIGMSLRISAHSYLHYVSPIKKQLFKCTLSFFSLCIFAFILWHWWPSSRELTDREWGGERGEDMQQRSAARNSDPLRLRQRLQPPHMGRPFQIHAKDFKNFKTL